MTPEVYCLDKAARPGSSLYYARLFIDPQDRRFVNALFALRAELSGIIDDCSDPGVAWVKLQWWRKELDKARAGVAEHPVGAEIARLLQNGEIHLESLQQILDGVETDLLPPDYASFDDLAEHCRRVSGLFARMTAEVLGSQAGPTLTSASELGLAHRLAEILGSVRNDADRGRVYLPADELDRFGVSSEALCRATTGEALRTLFSFQAERIRRHYQQALAMLPDIDRYRQRHGVILAAIQLATLDEIAADGYRILDHRVVLPPARKLWIAWKTAFRESRRHNKLLKSRRQTGG